MALPPGPRLPPAAQLAWFMANPVHQLETCRRRYGDMFTIRTPIFGTEVIVCRPSTVRSVFRGDPDLFRGGEANSALGIMLGEGSVLLQDGARHRRERKLLLPPFNGDRMRSYATVMQRQTERVVETWRHGEPLSLLPSMQRITLEVILRSVFGMDDGDELGTLRDALATMVEGPTSAIGMLPMMPIFQRDLGPLWPWAEFQRRMTQADQLIHRQIERARRRAARGETDRSDILSLLVRAVDDEGHTMSNRELRDELMTLLVAGHETTATSLAWAFEQILWNPAAHRRVVQELDHVVGTGELKAEHLPELSYLDAAIKETLRLRPIIGMLGRTLAAPTTLQGHQLDAGNMVVPCVYLAHRNADVYPQPERFEPERFIAKKADPYAWFPFGGGARRCIGMAFALYEMKVVLATILRRYRLRLRQRAPLRVVLRGFTFAPKGGTEVVVQTRVVKTTSPRPPSAPARPQE